MDELPCGTEISRPSSNNRPSSLARPARSAPCELNVQAQGPVAMSCEPPTIPGASDRIDEYPPAVGSEVMTSLADHRLAPRRLHVDDRRFAGHRDRLFECADPQLGVDGERGGAGDARSPSRRTVLKPASVNVTV